MSAKMAAKVLGAIGRRRSTMTPPENPNCSACQHFYVTWDWPLARACRAYDFRSAEYPATVVQASTGQACMQFEARAHAPRGHSADEAWSPVD
jgi:hypothetical protein